MESAESYGKMGSELQKSPAFFPAPPTPTPRPAFPRGSSLPGRFPVQSVTPVWPRAGERWGWPRWRRLTRGGSGSPPPHLHPLPAPQAAPVNLPLTSAGEARTQTHVFPTRAHPRGGGGPSGAFHIRSGTNVAPGGLGLFAGRKSRIPGRDLCPEALSFGQICSPFMSFLQAWVRRP